MDAYYSQRGQGPQKGQNDHDTREPDAVKAASPVRRGAVRKGLTGDTSLSKTGTVYGSISTSLAAYSTEYTTPPVSLTRGTLLEIFRRSSNKQGALVNPHAYATEAVRIIKSKLVDQLVDGIKYTKLNDWYE